MENGKVGFSESVFAHLQRADKMVFENTCNSGIIFLVSYLKLYVLTPHYSHLTRVLKNVVSSQ